MPPRPTPEEEKHEEGKTVFIIYEGHRTEPEYFRCFHSCHRSSNFNFREVPKFSFDTHNTEKGELVELMKGESTFLSSGNLTGYYLSTLILRKYSEIIGIDSDLETNYEKRKKIRDITMDRAVKAGICTTKTILDIDAFLNLIIDVATEVNNNLDRTEFTKRIIEIEKDGVNKPHNILGKSLDIYNDVFNKNEKKNTDRECQKRCKRLSRIRRRAVKMANERHILADDIVKDKMKMADIVMDLITKDDEYDNEYESQLRDPDLWDKKITNGIKGDRTFIVFDRDYDLYTTDYTRSDEYYSKVIKECEKLNYEVLLSTPDFEIWLLMHHDGVDFSEITYTDRATLNTKLCDIEKISMDSIKRIDDDRFTNNYKYTFETALKTSLQYKTDPVDLLNEIGTNVGVKLKSLL